MFVSVRMMGMVLSVFVSRMLVLMFVPNVDIKFYPRDGPLLPACSVYVVPFERQLFQLMLELMSIHSQIKERAQKHVAADSTEQIQIE